MFGLTTPWILAGLAAVGLPVLIHFLTRPRPRLIRFPTYHLLVEAGSGRQALDRLRTFLILALRVLAVAALVLLFTRPFLKSPGAEAAPGQARRVVLLVDASMSMRAVEGGIPIFARARAQAADVLRGLEPGSSAAVIFIAARPRAILPALSRNIAVLHEELAKAEPTLEKGDPAAALALAQRLLDGPGTVYIFSNFQRSNWGPVAFDSFHDLSFFLRPVTEKPIDNLGLTAVEKSPAEPVEDESIELSCSVFNSTPIKRRQTVRLDLQGVTRETAIDLQPYASGAAVFAFSLPQAGCFPGKVTILPDDLNDDNTRFIKLRVRRALRVLVVSDSDATDARSAAFFVEKAFCPSEYAATGIKILRRRSQDVDRASLETADAFLVVAPVQLSGEAVEIMARRVTDGAALICFLDGPTAPATVAALSAAGGALHPPFLLRRSVNAPDPRGENFASVASVRGPLKIFDSADQGDLKNVLLRRHYITETLANRQDDLLIRYADGSAALTLSAAGRGAVVFVNFPVALDGSDVAGSPLFPALLHELMRHLRTAAEDGATTPGFDWTIDVPAAPDGFLPAAASTNGDQPDFHVLAPDGRELKSSVVSRGRTVRLALPAVELPGHYAVKRGDATVDVAIVNVDPRETDTRQLNLADLVSDGSGNRRTTITVLNNDGELTSAGQARPLWPYLAALVLLVIAGEMSILAFWRRKPTAAAVRPRPGRVS